MVIKIEVKQYLVKPTHSGKTVSVFLHNHKVDENILQKKGMDGAIRTAIDVANDYVTKRINMENYIKVKKFKVTLRSYRNKELYKYEYSPTYRD